MRDALLLAGLLLLGTAQAQEEYRKVLVDDPYMCNGYFIKDVQKCRDAGIVAIDVEIHGIQQVDGSAVDRIFQVFHITDGLYGKVDLNMLAELKEDERAYYRLIARNASGDTLIDHAALPMNPDDIELVCSSTCEAPTWAWTIKAWQNNTKGTTNLVLGNAASPYGYYYCYVPLNDWGWWKDTHQPSEFGLWAIGGWNTYLSGIGQTEVVKLEQNLANGGGGAPEGAKSWLGYDLPPHTSVIGIRKDRGPYRVISATRQVDCAGCGGGVCDGLLAYYNAGSDVQQELAQHNLSPLWCPAMPSTEGVGELDMDSNNPFDDCTGLPVPPDGNMFNWINAVLDCIGNVGNGEGSTGGGSGPYSENVTYATLQVNHWYEDGTMDPVFGVDIPDAKDPKLIQVDKTELMPGLYEFVAVLNNGQIMRHFEAFDQPRIINADFADFISVNIYPVPVKGQEFAVDIDLLVPSHVNLTIVNNMGKKYYAKRLDFPQPGRNKHVVRMDYPWPSGIYHAIFQYGDGSSTSKNFSVQ